ncbi:MAG: Rrf2 family transcriptional regulator [Candidatus Omnitrophica bacterium]|nr:Rrf2 family transcriptional regulator [Candidatus Omnitrophota bacterium]
MKLSKKAEYALRAMILLAGSYRTGLLRIQDIAKREKIPQKFLENILVEIKTAGLIRSKRGAAGGYEFCMPPQKVTLAQVVRVIDGPLAPLSCVSRYAHISCPDEKKCKLKRVMLEVRNAVARVLEQVTFADICSENVQPMRGET